MSRTAPFLAALLAAALLAPSLHAGEQEEACRAQAERLSGYRPGGLQKEIGGVTFRLSGSVTLGVSRSRGSAPQPVPPFAGEAQRDRFEADRNRKRATRYQTIYDDCMKKSSD